MRMRNNRGAAVLLGTGSRGGAHGGEVDFPSGPFDFDLPAVRWATDLFTDTGRGYAWKAWLLPCCRAVSVACLRYPH
jgi:hypothetical protein